MRGLGRGRSRLASALMRSTPSSRGRRRGSGRWSRPSPGASPALRSTVTVTSRGFRSTVAGSAAGRRPPADPDAVHRDVEVGGVEGGPRRADAGEDAAPVGVVAEDRGLEQVAAGDRLRPTSTASSSVAALSTVMAISWSAPSASREQLHGEVGAGLGERVGRSRAGVGRDRRWRRWPAAVTVSLVDMQPSESSRSKLTRVAARSAVSRSAAATTASVVRTTSMVASWGASMPAPLAMPPIDQPAPVDDDLLGDASRWS